MTKAPDTPAARIREAMADKGVRAVDLAKACGVSQPTVSGWLNGGHGLRNENIRKAARALRVSPGYLLFGVDTEAERTTQDTRELGVLRCFRDIDDDEQEMVLRMMIGLARKHLE